MEGRELSLSPKEKKMKVLKSATSSKVTKVSLASELKIARERVTTLLLELKVKPIAKVGNKFLYPRAKALRAIKKAYTIA